MATQRTTQPKTTEVAIFGRLLDNSRGEMSPKLAQYVLTLGFPVEDQARMESLAARNQEGALSAAEKEELLASVKAGHLLALLHSQAREALKRKKAS